MRGPGPAVMNDQGRAREQPVVRGVANDAEIRWQPQRICAAPAWIEQGSLAGYGSNHDVEQRALIETQHAAESHIDRRVARGEKTMQRCGGIPLAHWAHPLPAHPGVVR